MTDRPIPAPSISPETKAFWDAAASGRFMLPYCEACGRTHWYPRAICPHCFGNRMRWQEASCNGTIYSFSTMRRAEIPYTIAYVTLAEGPTMMTNIVDCDPDALQIGQKVRLAWKPTEGGPPVPMFTLG